MVIVYGNRPLCRHVCTVIAEKLEKQRFDLEPNFE